MRFVALLALLLLGGADTPPRSSPFLGADACGTCHAAIATSWRATAHARALSSLDTKEVASARCRSCHATGLAPLGRSELPGVQCEACHGAGVDYAPDDVMRDPALARAMGLRDLSTPVARQVLCMRCHRAATRLAPFEVEAAWRSIAH